MSILEGLFQAGAELLSYFSILGIVWLGANQLHDNLITAGSLTSFLLYTVYVVHALAALAHRSAEFMKGVGASERMFSIMDIADETKARKYSRLKEAQKCQEHVQDEEKAEIIIPTKSNKPLKLETCTGHIAFEDVHFTYPSRPNAAVLQGISFDMFPG